MILIINICKERLHAFEFVKPIEDILKSNKTTYFTKHYLNLNEKDIKEADKVVICGTSLKDFDYFNHVEKFEWIKSFEKPILGICGGMEIIAKMFNGRLVSKKLIIGLKPIRFHKEFLGLEGDKEAYFLHQLWVASVSKGFNYYSDPNKGIQAIKHKTKPIYGVLFHPEVRNKQMVENFAKI